MLHEQQWSGKPCVVIGGGPSLKGVDPSVIPEGVPSIGCNGAYLWNPTIVFFIDWRFYELVKDRDDWKACTSTRIMHKSCIQYPASNEAGAYWIPIGRGTVQWGINFDAGLAGLSNTGVMAVNLADILGCDPILLLGFDLLGIPCPEKGEARSANFHTLYPESWTTGDSVYTRFLDSFVRCLRYSGKRVINCNPDSALDLFPKCTLDEGMAIARGDVDPAELFPNGKLVGTTSGPIAVRCKADEGNEADGRLAPDLLSRLLEPGETGSSRRRIPGGMGQSRRVDLGGRVADGPGDPNRCRGYGSQRGRAGVGQSPEEIQEWRAGRDKRLAAALTKADTELAKFVAKPSNINEHLETLRELARGQTVVAEFGSGTDCRSTLALIAGRPERVLSYDLTTPSETLRFNLGQYGADNGTVVEFIEKDTGRLPTLDRDVDLLLIDSAHNCEQVTAELVLNAHRVLDYIVFHDVVSFPFIDQAFGGNVTNTEPISGDDTGVMRAVLLFLRDNVEWTVAEFYQNNNGLLVLQRYDRRPEVEVA